MAIRQIIAGKYELGAMIARGGMGSVWRARHLSLDIDVAVKLMSTGLASSPEQRARFAREARAAAQIKSPHVVQIHDHGVEEETPYIVMELLAGEDLGARLRRETRLAPTVTVALARQMGRGLRKAHEMGIVHRDLKPANIFLARTDDEEDLVKILDFGIARAGAAGDSTLTGELLGSPPYMSPEQARGLKSLDHRTDQWSLGVVLFRMLAGRLPFQGDQAGDVIVKICTEEAPLLSSVAPGLPGALDGFFRRVLHRIPDRRFASIRELVDAFIEAATPGVPARPSAPSFPEALAMPHVPPGRTTVRMDRPLPPVVATPPLALNKTAPPMQVWSALPALPFTAGERASRPPVEESPAMDAATTSSGTTRPAAPVPPVKSRRDGATAQRGLFWVGLVVTFALVGAMTGMIVRRSVRSSAAASTPVSVEVSLAQPVPAAPPEIVPSGATTAPLGSSAAPAATVGHPPRTGTLPTGTLPTGVLQTGTLPVGSSRPVTPHASASATATAAPDPSDPAAQKRVIYE